MWWLVFMDVKILQCLAQFISSSKGEVYFNDCLVAIVTIIGIIIIILVHQHKVVGTKNYFQQNKQPRWYMTQRNNLRKATKFQLIIAITRNRKHRRATAKLAACTNSASVPNLACGSRSVVYAYRLNFIWISISCHHGRANNHQNITILTKLSYFGEGQ